MPGSSRTYVHVWYCDDCHFGPLNISIDAHCVNCGHQRCSYCKVETHKAPRNS
ncbi:hypothetical protein QBC41DRAFT_8722 [Cercophora samala]|uniref:Uncharacterized protein n=1 Tax=Cercophora samala TaxID=330535 RepID=A0AA40DA08_9PEZI|nr:hypothetical protein QBC41DRAFT_8722 [Cercophora samala]